MDGLNCSLKKGAEGLKEEMRRREEGMKEEMRTFVLAVGSSILIVGKEEKDEDEEEHGHRISVHCSGWDYQLHRFLPPTKWSIPLSGNMRVVAAENVATYESGEIEPYLVLASSSALAMGVLDISKHKFVIVAQIAYHQQDYSAKLECLLINGPTTIASLPGQILVMYPHHFRDSKHGNNEYKSFEPLWIACVLNIVDIHMGADMRLLFAHDGNAACTPEVVLGICNVSKDIIFHPQVDWKYIRLDLYSLGCYMLNIAPNHSDYSVEQLWKSDSVLCNEIFPADLNPFTISCIKLVPVDPLSLASDASGLETRKSESFPDIIIGTYDNKILKCRHGKIIADAYLKNVPVSLTFAIVAGGQGVLLTTLASIEQNVIALCCETLQPLEVWSNVGNVITGDFQRVGHDQVLLVKSPAHCRPGAFHLEDLLCSMTITDFNRSGFIGLNDPQQELKFTDRFEAISHKNRHIQAVARFLETRIEVGKSQEMQLKLQMEKKKHLLESSCVLMEGLTSRHNLAFVEENSHLESKNTRSKIKGHGLHLMEIEQVYHALRGRTWFVIIGIWSRVPRGLILDEATLLLVTVEGQISGGTSSIRRINTRDKFYKFVVTVPLQNFSAFPCFPVVNIMLKAWLTSEEAVYQQSSNNATKIHGLFRSSIVQGTHRCLHTEWLGRICIEENDLIRQFVDQGLSHVIHGVGESQVFMFRPKGENDPFTLPCEIKSVLCMDYSRKECKNLQVKESRICELVTRSTSPFGEAYVYVFKDVAMLTLYVEDSGLLSCMAALLISIFGHRYDVYQYRTCEKILRSILDFMGAFFRELGVKSSTWEGKHCDLRQCQTMQEYHKNLELLTDKGCLHLIPTTRF